MHKPSQLAIPTTYARGAVIGRTRADAIDRLRAELGRGRVAATHGAPVLLTHGVHAGQYAIPVRLIIRPQPAPAPRWTRVVIIVGGALSGLALSLALLLWVIASMSAVALASLLVALLAAFSVWVWARHGRSRGPRSVTVTTTIDF